MKIIKILSIFIIFLILDIFFTKSYQIIKLNLYSENNSMTINEIYHHELKKNYEGKGHSDEIIFTNKYGLITLKNETKINLEDKTNIIFMGDSFTQGAGVPYKNSFAGILTKKLEDQKKIINLSAVSYSPSIYFYKTKYFIENYNMKFSEMYLFIDISDPYDELYRYKVKNEKVVNQTNLSNPFVKNEFEQIVYNIKSFVIKNTTVLFFISKNIKNFFKKKNNDEEKFYENYGFIINHQANLWTFDENYYEKQGYKGVELCKKYLALLNQMLKDNNAKLTIVVYPWPGQIFRNDNNFKQSYIWSRWAEENNIDFINLSDAFFETDRETVSERLKFIDNYFLKKDMHFNINGHKIVAEKILKILD